MRPLSPHRPRTIPTGHADGHGVSTARHWSSTPPKLTSVGVKKARVLYPPRGVDMPAPSVMATNSYPTRVAAAVAAIIKKLSQPWSIGEHCSP